MAASAESTLDSIERRRAQLQESVDKLQRALAHWTTWEAEYALFKEELERAADPSPAHMRAMAQDLDASLLTDREVGDLLGHGRAADQVAALVQRRIDYVQLNSAAVEKQLDAAEKQLAGVDVLLDPGVDNEEGLPMMDIEEELDEAGNAVSASVNQTGAGAAEVVEALRRAGLQRADLDKMMQGAGSATEAAAPARAALEKDGYNEDLDALNFTRGTKVIELDQDDNMVAAYPIIPQGESPEDAELRRQMLQYGLSEVGQVVAELELDHPTAEYSDLDDDDDDDDYDEDDDDDDEDEDEHGRSTAPGVTDDYRQQMLELERKLNARMLENIGPQADDDQTVEQAESVRLLKVQKDDKFDETIGAVKPGPSPQPGRKGVRFADELDISEPPPVRAPESASPLTPAATMSDTIVERAAAPPFAAAAAPSQPAKQSRFKSARSHGPPAPLPNPAVFTPQPTPTGPANRTLASTIVERPRPSDAAPSAPDEFDPALLSREIALEYHKARNKFIQQRGGFEPDERDRASPIVEQRGGKTKKVSRFMAAKLAAEGL
ncbi:uncharacterized protein M421DRAFT_103328 [Didymella exigua CBS 183.55]|uniref:DUF3835 domain-containing protein n=1 Tax=Didymella exigua CBS 183.55 TaxID=1150837 RepID=A0A6A5RCG2_9PLEO|nr:uncharacterized protein M421DRAFT_103328 [Didymella exigua CBS 183.55]KAF1925069.1 hypothetical protein M421DRAFT_103328 [Didymella exigua CBS 183.55]